MEQMKEAISELTGQLIELTRSKDFLRTAEANNILQIVYVCRRGLESGEMGFMEADDTLHQVAQRVQFLLENPNHAGQHEKHRQ